METTAGYGINTPRVFETFAAGELAKTQHWVETSLACPYISPPEYRDLLSKSDQIGKMLGKILAQPEKWCPLRK